MSSNDNFISPISFAEEYEFVLTDPNLMTFKVIEIGKDHRDYDEYIKENVISKLTSDTLDKLESAPTRTNPHLKTDMIVTLVSGKWPLGDYHDNDGTVIQQFKTSDGTLFSTILFSFCHYCCIPIEKQIQNLKDVKISFSGVLVVLDAE
jgi:hypothetical protein